MFKVLIPLALCLCMGVLSNNSYGQASADTTLFNISKSNQASGNEPTDLSIDSSKLLNNKSPKSHSKEFGLNNQKKIKDYQGQATESSFGGKILSKKSVQLNETQKGSGFTTNIRKTKYNNKLKNTDHLMVGYEQSNEPDKELSPFKAYIQENKLEKVFQKSLTQGPVKRNSSSGFSEKDESGRDSEKR